MTASSDFNKPKFRKGQTVYIPRGGKWVRTTITGTFINKKLQVRYYRVKATGGAPGSVGYPLALIRKQE